jgi:outer membrane biosynthesis protein TonB
MRNGQNNKRMRNRNNNNNNRRGQNPMTRVFESNGPDIKIRGTASHIAEKYLQLARDARSSGDPVAAENYYQHAEHYFRLIAAAQEQFRQNQPQQARSDEVTLEDGEDDGESFSNFGQEPGFVPAQQPQPYMRDGGQRDQPRDNQQPFQRDQQQPRDHREREHRQQPQYQPQPQPQQPVAADNGGGVDRLPSFITGPQPQINGGPGGYEGGGERYPRRRRRQHGPRPDNSVAEPAAPSEDLNPSE